MTSETERLQDAKRRALAIADERAKENVRLRAERDALVKALEELLDANERLSGLSYYHQGRDAAIATQEVAERNARELIGRVGSVSKP
jgi:hypothetical protein